MTVSLSSVGWSRSKRIRRSSIVSSLAGSWTWMVCSWTDPVLTRPTATQGVVSSQYSDPGRGLFPIQCRLVLPDQETSAPRPDPEDEPRRAEIAVRDPQVAGINPRQDLVDQGPLLSIGVLAGDGIDDQHARQVEDHQGLARQDRGTGRTRRPDAVFGPGQVVPVEDLGAVARHRLGQGGVELVHQRLEPPGRLGDEAATDPRFNPLELLVDGRQRRGDLAERGEVGGADRGLDAADDGTHQLDDRGEEEFAGVLVGSGALKEAIEFLGVECTIQEGAEHDGDGGLLEEALESLAKLHGCLPCVEWLSWGKAISYR